MAVFPMFLSSVELFVSHWGYFGPVALLDDKQMCIAKKPFSAETRVPSSEEKQCAGVRSLA